MIKLNKDFLLFFNVLISLVAFQLCFGNACYEYGLNAGHSDGLWTVILFPFVYFVVLIATIVVFHKDFYSAKPYIVMGIIPVAFIALIWIAFCVAKASATDSNPVLWFPITLTVLSAIMSALYFIKTFQFYHKGE